MPFAIRGLILAAAILLGSHTAAAGGWDATLAAPDQPVRPGDRIGLPVYFHNTAGHDLRIDPPARTPCRIVSAANSWTVSAALPAPDKPEGDMVGAGRFAVHTYWIDLPDTLRGTVQLSLPELAPGAVALSVDAEGSSARSTSTSAPGQLAAASRHPLDDLLDLYQPYARNISFYEPMYFLVGTDPQNSKFQVSLKYRFFNPSKPLAASHPWVQGFHFGYTQTSFWDLKSDSAPFEDTSYKPELFYLSTNIASRPAWCRGLFLQTGLRHESNGRGGNLSRSTNTVYIEPALIAYDNDSRFGLRISPRLWAYIGNDNETNGDLYAYRGYFDLKVTVGKANHMVLDTRLRWARKGASIETDLTYPLHRLFGNNLDLYFQAQYVSSLAESLLHYTERTNALRLGIAIVR